MGGEKTQYRFWKGERQAEINGGETQEIRTFRWGGHRDRKGLGHAEGKRPGIKSHEEAKARSGINTNVVLMSLFLGLIDHRDAREEDASMQLQESPVSERSPAWAIRSSTETNGGRT